MSTSQFLTVLTLLATCFVFASCQSRRPIVDKPDGLDTYTKVLTIDGGGLRCLIPTMVAIEIENSIKRYLVRNPELLPSEFESIDDFTVLLADYFDAMSGVSGGSWTTAYLASKGGDGTVQRIFRQRRIRRDYGNIIPGEAQGLMVFFLEYGDTFYPGGPPQVTVTPPTMNVSLLPNFSNLGGLLSGDSPQQVPFQLPSVEIPGLNAPVYSVEGLERALNLFLGNVRLSQLDVYYVVHAYDLNSRRNVYFIHDNQGDPAQTFTSHVVTRDVPREVPDNADDDDFEYSPDNDQVEGLDFYMREVVRGSSAVASFHEAKVMSPIDNPNITYTFIDGATITNNPALQALIFLTSAPRSIPTEEIAMISLGTGVSYDAYVENANSGPLGWLLNNELLSIMTEGGAENVQAQVDYMFYGNRNVRPNQYLRVQVSAERNTTTGEALTSVTDAQYLPTYESLGRRVARRYRGAINDFVSHFIFESEA
eukprot:g7498.t1